MKIFHFFLKKTSKNFFYMIICYKFVSTNKGTELFKLQKIKIMRTKLEIFTVWTPTEFGIGLQKIKAKSFEDAFKRLGKKDKMKDGWIDDEAGETKTFSQILGIEEFI